MKTGNQRIADGGRIHAIDTAKGIAILFVVFGHAWRGSFDAGVLHNEILFNTIDQMIYAWHMPIFFFLTGVLFLDVIRNMTASDFFFSRLVRLLWPFALWTWIFFAVRLLAGSAANHPVTLSDFPINPFPPYEHLWFLWALLLVQLVVLFLYLGLRPVVQEGTFRIICAACALVSALCIPWIHFGSSFFDPAIAHFPYYIAGVGFAGLITVRPPLWMALAAACGIVFLLFCGLMGWGSVLNSLVLVLLIWIMLARIDCNTHKPLPVIRMLRYLGQTSLVIYLAHTIFSAAARIGLLSLDITSLGVHLLAAVGIGVVGPLVLLWCAGKLGTKKALGL